MKGREMLVGIILGFTLTVGIVYPKVNDFFTAPSIDVFQIATVKLDKSSYSLKDIKDKHLIINIWATWCAPCIKEMPYLTSLEDRLNKEEWQLVLISDEELEKIISFKEKREIKLEMLKATESLSAVGIKAYPTTYVIDKNDQVIFRRNGELKLFQKEFEDAIKSIDPEFPE